MLYRIEKFAMLDNYSSFDLNGRRKTGSQYGMDQGLRGLAPFHQVNSSISSMIEV